MLQIIAHIQTANISYLSPSTTTKSGFNLSKASPKLIIATPIDLFIPILVSELKSISTFSSIINPSSSIVLYVRPNSVDKCEPVTKTCKISSLSSFIACIIGFNSPYSALEPVTIHIFFIIAQSFHLLQNLF